MMKKKEKKSLRFADLLFFCIQRREINQIKEEKKRRSAITIKHKSKNIKLLFIFY